LLTVNLGQIFREKINKNYINPFVSIIVAVHNEEKNIKARIENLLNQDYPNIDKKKNFIKINVRNLILTLE